MAKIVTYLRHLASLLTILLLLQGCGKQPQASYVKVEGEMLGTFLTVSARTTHPASEIYNLMMEIDAASKRSMSIFDDSSRLSQINSNLTDEVDEHIAYCLELSRRISKQSDGAYDVTVAPLVKAYGFAAQQREAKINIDSLLEFVGIDKVQIIDNRLHKTDKRVQIDFNSIAKGYVVDMAAEALEELGIEDYLVDIGGEVRCKGVNAKGGPWRIGIETPFDGNNSMGEFVQQVISLSNSSMATSGNYRRFYIDENGQKVSHTIDPRTGRSAVTTLLSATVIAPTCAEADAYGTMFMAMPLDKALAKARELQAEGIKVYFIAAGQSKEYDIYYSASLAEHLAATDGNKIM